MFGRVVLEGFVPSTLEEAEAFFVSKRLRLGVVGGRDVSPRMVSLATCVEAEDLGARGHDPYQLRDLCTCFAVATGPALAWGLVDRSICSDVALVCDDALGWVVLGMFGGGGLAELPSAGFGRTRFRGLILTMEDGVSEGSTPQPRCCISDGTL